VIYAWVPFNNFIGFVPDLLVLLLLQGEYCAYAALPVRRSSLSTWADIL